LSVVLAILAGLVLAGAATAADLEAGRKKAEVCAACHGPGGNATIPGMPSISAMPVFYTHWQLIMYRDGRRKDPQMTPFAERLTDADMADLSAHYAAQKAVGRPAATDPARVAAGARLAPALHCTSCHGPTLMGQQAVGRLAGQDLDYLRRRLRGYKDKTTSDLDGQMTAIAQTLTEADIEDLAHYMASLGVGP
jgi:cytochrome c553